MSVLVSNIQRFSLNDGPGIRTTIFTVGCNLRCPWCANPENVVCDAKMAEKTSNQLRQIEYSIEDLYNIIMRDYEYYGDEGGVTFSGGEPLLWSDELIDLFVKLKENNITICVETALGLTLDKIKRVFDYIDYFYIDLKTTNADKYDLIIGEWENFINNFCYLERYVKLAKITIRIPIIKNFNHGKEDLQGFVDFIQEHNIKEVYFLPGHNLARRKYELLDKVFFEYGIDDDIKKKVFEFINNIKEIKTKIIFGW